MTFFDPMPEIWVQADSDIPLRYRCTACCVNQVRNLALCSMVASGSPAASPADVLPS
jgi:hypothetical protein